MRDLNNLTFALTRESHEVINSNFNKTLHIYRLYKLLI